MLLPAAYHSLAGQGQVKEVLPCSKREGVFQRLSVDDEGKVVLLVEGISQHATVVTESLSGGLLKHKYKYFYDYTKTMAKYFNIFSNIMIVNCMNVILYPSMTINGITISLIFPYSNVVQVR